MTLRPRINRMQDSMRPLGIIRPVLGIWNSSFTVAILTISDNREFTHNGVFARLGEGATAFPATAITFPVDPNLIRKGCDSGLSLNANTRSGTRTTTDFVAQAVAHAFSLLAELVPYAECRSPWDFSLQLWCVGLRGTPIGLRMPRRHGPDASVRGEG
jgi:hypothetical protein